MHIGHPILDQFINLRSIKHHPAHAIRQALRVSGNSIVLVRIEGSCCLNAEFVAESVANLSYFVCQEMLAALDYRRQNISEGLRLALIRAETIRSVHRMHED